MYLVSTATGLVAGDRNPGGVRGAAIRAGVGSTCLFQRCRGRSPFVRLETVLLPVPGLALVAARPLDAEGCAREHSRRYPIGE